MSSKHSSRATEKAVEANEEICRAYQEAFDARIADSTFQPEGSRISELEQLWRKAEIIESKKDSTAQRG